MLKKYSPGVEGEGEGGGEEQERRSRGERGKEEGGGRRRGKGRGRKEGRRDQKKGGELFCAFKKKGCVSSIPVVEGSK